MKKWFFLAIVGLFYSVTFAEEKLNILYVHIGSSLPNYLIESINQARLHNPDEDIYICGNAEALHKDKENLSFLNVKGIAIETLPKSEQHQRFLRETPFTDLFWRYTTERLLIVHELIKQQDLENIFHIESDVMIYGSFREKLPVFTEMYQSIAIPFLNDYVAVCSVVFFKNEGASRILSDCIARNASRGKNDMRLPGILKEEMGVTVIDHLPILPLWYVKSLNHDSFISKLGHRAKNKFDFCKYSEEFSCVFDAATLGVFLSRQDSICEGTIFDPRLFDIIWKSDEKNFYSPYLRYHQFECKIFNLHVHSKRLDEFRSDKTTRPISWIKGRFVND